MKAQQTHTSGREKWWIFQQHDEFHVEKRVGRPEVENKERERIWALHGPFDSEDLAQKRKEELYSRTLKARAEKAGL